jgi:ADP-heptose:LPS heptosyltransferase
MPHRLPWYQQPSPHFLITRLSHIGDCVLTLPLAEALKRYWPHGRVTWAMESPTPKLLGHHPAIDQVLVVPRGYLRNLSAIRSLRHQLKAAQIDVVVDPQSLTKSALLGWLSGAPLRVGFGGRYGKELSTWLHTRRVTPPDSVTHLLDRSLSLADDLWNLAQVASGAAVPAPPADSPLLNLPLPEAPRRWVRLQQAVGDLPARFAVLNPGASWPSKRWENDRWAQVARELANQGLPVVVTWAGPEERGWAQEIVHGAGREVFLAPETSLLEMAALCQASTLFLGCDTGPMHMATAVGTRCVVLLGPTRPQDSGPYGPSHISLQAWHQVDGSGRRKQAANHAMRAIGVEQVVAACQQQLQVPSSATRKIA